MTIVIPLLDVQEPRFLKVAARIGPVITRPSLSSRSFLPRLCYLLVDEEGDSSLHSADLVKWLDSGVDKLIVPLGCAKDLVGLGVPPKRICLLLDVANFSAVSNLERDNVSGGVFLRTPSIDLDFIKSVSEFFSGSSVFVDSTSSMPNLQTIRSLSTIGATLVLPTSKLTLENTTTDCINIADAFTAPLSSDRSDGLFPTIVTNEIGRSLGLVYSSGESLRESILTGKGVYHSRKHGLWRKGETSGATQEVISIRLDCDSDSLEFRVVQSGSGFCHLNRPSCFGDIGGLSALQDVLCSRLASAPSNSYTRRLFDDPYLLCSKIMEEADELCEAVDREEVAFEAADLLYFALTKCVKAGVRLADIEDSLALKAKQIIRRPGHAKPQRTDPPVKSLSRSTQSDEFICMRTVNLEDITSADRAQLLKRPAVKFDEMIVKVKPIVNDVRERGDIALLELTAKFDKAQMTSTVIFPPFAPESMKLDTNVQDAIDLAYENIYKFHKAQDCGDTLVVETTPGVVCSRFARPVSRVGLYVPGGTAILPSTALMLGIPAQVAQCKTVVLATPPRPDGTISPEVMYVAHRIGASAILKAGGAQAIAALAYGTTTVPKVDKIFGPGNQWVTAAKMLVQNDTDALVSIDMPAGPSEVLVIADASANPAFVAADLLSQAEHGIDSQVVLVAVNLNSEQLSHIQKQVDEQARALSRAEIVRVSISKSIIVKVFSVEEAIAFSNDYSPEHLILHLENASEQVCKVENAGSIFVGPYTPESCGDYASGTNHTLPTNGYARQFSGVNTSSFQKNITSQEISKAGLELLGPVVATLADCEGLQAHANAVRIRLRTKY